MGTFNRLAFLGDSYLELIGVFDPDRVAANPSFAVGAAACAVLGAGREGFATYALATTDIEVTVARLRSAGSRIGNPVAGARRRPDGETVRWVTAFPTLGPERAPFLIEHELVGAEWGDVARASRATLRHPVGGPLRLAGIELPAADPATTMRDHVREVGLRFDDRDTARVGAQRIRVRAADGEPPIVDIVAEPGTPTLDVVLFGVRWRRRAMAARSETRA